MSETLLIIEPDVFDALVEKKQAPQNLVDAGYAFKGFVLAAGIVKNGPALYVNPVFGIPDSDGTGDVIIQSNLAACPYPPGYTGPAKNE